VLYLEGSTDLAILREFAEHLDHRVKPLLDQPFIHYVGNVLSKAKEHFYGLRESKPDLVGVAIFDSDTQQSESSPELLLTKWRQREIENYLCFPETLLQYADKVADNPGPSLSPSSGKNNESR
jgi:hypothetical protein